MIVRTNTDCFKKLLFCFLLINSCFHANATTLKEPSILPMPKLAAKAYILIDYNSGKVLAEKKAHVRLAPASLTKIMTAYIVSKNLTSNNLSLTQKTQVSTKAWKMHGSRMFIEQGKWVTVDDLLHGLIIQSGNDATVALAEMIAGSESGMVDLMNQEAKQLKLNNTHFANSTGLPHSNHYSTASDLAILTQHIIHDFPKEYPIYAKKWFRYNNIKQANRNKLLWQDASIDGVKTGMTDKAGYCLIASAKRDNMRLIAVVLGAKSNNTRAQQAAQLLHYGYNNFKTKLISTQNTPLKTIEVWMGKKNNLTVGLKQDWYITLPKDQLAQLQAEITIKKPLMAPISQNTIIGHLNLKIKDKLFASKPIVSLETIDKANFFSRTLDYLKYKLISSTHFIKNMV